MERRVNWFQQYNVFLISNQYYIDPPSGHHFFTFLLVSRQIGWKFFNRELMLVINTNSNNNVWLQTSKNYSAFISVLTKSSFFWTIF